MTMVSILFVLNEIMQTEHSLDETIFSIGFGPGISIETAMFAYVDFPVSLNGKRETIKKPEQINKNSVFSKDVIPVESY